MSYAEIQDVLYALEITGTDARKNCFIGSLIDAAEEMVNEICGTEFEEQTRVEEIVGECSRYFYPKGSNISKVMFVGVEEYQVIKVTSTGYYLNIEFTKDGDLKVTIDANEYSTSFDETNTIQEVVDYLTNSLGLTATLQDSNYGDQNALSLWSTIQTAQSESSDIILYLTCATATSVRKVQENMYVCNRTIGSNEQIKFVYTSGYSTIPANVKQATILATSMMYRSLTQDTSLKSESIGNYSYSNNDVSLVNASIRNAIRPLLAKYRIKTI